MISYGTVDLSFPDPEALARAQRLLDPAEVWPWALRHMPPPRQGYLGWLPHRDMPFRLNSLVWPTGASRWAYGHYLITSRMLVGVLDAISRAGGGTCDLILNDGNRSLTTALYALPPRPLFAVPAPPGSGGLGAGQLHLLTLVDNRWRWWWTAADVVGSDHTTWAELYAAVGEALGVTITADTVASAYLAPPAELTARYQAIPPLLDAVAIACGQRIVRDPDGTVRALNAATSQSREAVNLLLSPRKAGGALYTGV